MVESEATAGIDVGTTGDDTTERAAGGHDGAIHSMSVTATTLPQAAPIRNRIQLDFSLIIGRSLCTDFPP